MPCLQIQAQFSFSRVTGEIYWVISADVSSQIAFTRVNRLSVRPPNKNTLGGGRSVEPCLYVAEQSEGLQLPRLVHLKCGQGIFAVLLVAPLDGVCCGKSRVLTVRVSPLRGITLRYHWLWLYPAYPRAVTRSS